MGFEPAYQWAVLAFGAQSAVDLPERRFGDAHDDGLAYALQGGRHFGADSAECHAVGVRVGGFHHVDQVHVGYIVELPCAQFAHADDGETYMFAAVHFMACDGECTFERRVRKVGKFGADARLDFGGIVCRGVLRHDCGELFAIGFTQRRRSFGKWQICGRHGMVIGIGSYRFEHMRSALFVIVKVAFAGIVGCGLHEFWTESHELAEGVRDAEHGDEPFERRFVGHHGVEVAPLALHRVGDVDEVGKRAVRVAHLGQGLEHANQPFVGHAVGFEPVKVRACVIEVLQPDADQVHGRWMESVHCVHI